MIGEFRARNFHEQINVSLVFQRNVTTISSHKETRCMDPKFEWDETKAKTNLINHGVSFEFATRVFLDPHRLEWDDGREDYGEERFLTIGLANDKELVVVFTHRIGNVRLISARKANRHEQSEYWKNR